VPPELAPDQVTDPAPDRPGAGDPSDGPAPPDLTDGVVRLRALRPADVGTGAPGEHSIVGQCTDPESLRWTTVPEGYTPAMGTEWVAEAAAGWAARRSYVLAVVDAQTDDFLGSVDLRPDVPATCEVGFGLGPWARGRGVMPRALVLLLGWAFAPAPTGLGLDLVRWRANAGNWPSRRAAWKVGFRGFTTVRGLLDHRGVAVDGWVATVRAGEVGVPDGRWLTVPTLSFSARDGSAFQLRPWREDDEELEAVVRACSDAVTQRWLSHLSTPYTADDALAFLQSRPEGPATGSSLSWAVAPADGGAAVASISVFRLTEPYGNPELGWWADPVVRGRGVVAAAVRRVAGWLFEDAPEGVRTHRLVVEADAGNDASARVALAAGFTEFGRGHAEDPDPAGGWSDCRYFERLRSGIEAGAGIAGGSGVAGRPTREASGG